MQTCTLYLPAGLVREHGVVGENVADVELKQVEALGDLGDDGVGYIADIVLRVEQHGDEGGTLHRIKGYQVVKACGRLGRKDRVCNRCSSWDFLGGKGEADFSHSLRSGRNDNQN